jgi:hypothetical protein
MTEHLHKDPQYWRRELRRHLERGRFDTPELEPVISDPFDVKTVMYEQIIAGLDS